MASNISLVILLIVATASPVVFGGSPCPTRKSLYPCTCLNVPQAKRQNYTSITCQRLKDSDSLEVIFNVLQSMNIDHLLISDSFWGGRNRNLPKDWINLFKIREVQIQDTDLDPMFGCQGHRGSNQVITSIEIDNGTSLDSRSNLCDTGKGDKYSWTGSMPNLQRFRLSHGRLATLGQDLFPQRMDHLNVLSLTNNHLSKIESKAFTNLKSLTHLDLSKNALEAIGTVFNTSMDNLIHFDLSWNFIKTMGRTVFIHAVKLKFLNLEGNQIVALKEVEWQKATHLKKINLKGNPLRCDCGIRWLNATLPRSVALDGTCDSPPHYRDTSLRRASKFVVERCNKITTPRVTA